MGIVCSLYRAPDSTLTTLVERPEFFHDLAMLEKRPLRFEVGPGLIGRLLGKKPRIVQLGHDDLPFERITSNKHHSVDKAWHVLHFLMTGSASESDQPLGFFLSGGLSVGEQRAGCDAVPRAMLAAETKKIVDAFGALTIEVVSTRFDWPEMMRQGVYPEIARTERVPADLWADYLAQFYHLKEFVAQTAQLGQGFAISYG